jgi:hypothetical protein
MRSSVCRSSYALCRIDVNTMTATARSAKHDLLYPLSKPRGYPISLGQMAHSVSGQCFIRA